MIRRLESCDASEEDLDLESAERVMVGLAILLVFDLLGFVLHRYSGVPLPENVLGMILLLAGLGTGVVKVQWVEGCADFLLRNMMLFFAPVIVGVVPLMSVIEVNFVPISAGLIASTLATLLVTAWLAQLLMRREAPDGH